MIKSYPTKKLGEILDYEQPGKYIVNSKNYSSDYKTPVLTAGKTFILGNTSEEESIFPTNKLPVIIFDDFTTAIKFVDFPFKVKSSAMKILHAKKDIADIKYLFYLMQTMELNHVTHKRYWISEYSQIEIPLPPLEIQKKIVKKIEELFAKITQAQSLRESAIQDTNNLIPATLSKIFEEGKRKEWEEKELGEVSKVVTGGTPKTHITEYYGNKYLWARPGDLNEDLVVATEKRLSPSGFKNGGVRPIPAGSVMMCCIGSIGKIGIASEETSTNQQINSFVPDTKKIDGKFLFYSLIYVREKFIAGASSTTLKIINKSRCEKIKTPLPPLAEQKKIVERMDTLMQKVRELQKLQSETATNLTALKQSILHKAFQGEL